MQYWLFKSEPSTWSWEDQKQKGAKGEPWDGVRNYQARNNMMKMKKGDRGLFYHSVKEKRVVGIVEVIKEHYPDYTAKEDDRWQMVDIKALRDIKKPVSLADMKANPELKDLSLIKQGRLSVCPISKKEFFLILHMGETNPSLA